MLEYDVFDPQEFVSEFVCDVGTKKSEKADYAILSEGEPIILIEAKRVGMKLQKQQQINFTDTFLLPTADLQF